MSVTITPLNDEVGTVLIGITASELENFKHLVQRAMNTWQDAPVSMREFADKLLHGYVRQDYAAYDHINHITSSRVRPTTNRLLQYVCLECNAGSPDSHTVDCSEYVPYKVKADICNKCSATKDHWGNIFHEEDCPNY